MSPFDYTPILTQAVDELSDSLSYQGLFHQYKDGEPLPSGKTLHHIVELARPFCFQDTSVILPSTAVPSITTLELTLKNCLVC